MRSAYFPWSGHGWVQSAWLRQAGPSTSEASPAYSSQPFLGQHLLEGCKSPRRRVCACVYMYICKCACVSCLRVQISQSTAANTVGDSGCLDVPQ